MKDTLFKRLRWLLFGDPEPTKAEAFKAMYFGDTGGKISLTPEELERELARVTALLKEQAHTPKMSLNEYLIANNMSILAGAHARKKFSLIEKEEQASWAPVGKVTVVIGGTVFEIEGPEMTPGQFRDLLVEAQVGAYVMDPYNTRSRAEFINTREPRQQALPLETGVGPAESWTGQVQARASDESALVEMLEPVEHDGLTEEEEKLVDLLRNQGYTEDQIREVLKLSKEEEKES